MNLTDAEVREFATLWRDAFDEKLSPDQARGEATRLIELYLLLARPVPKERTTGPAHRPSSNEV